MSGGASESGSRATLMPRLSVVIPFYNERASIEPLYREVRLACDRLAVPYEFVLVDDGSVDGTFEVLAALHTEDPRVRVVRFRRNFGQSAALAAGIELARGEIVVTMDGDLQNDPADIGSLLDKLAEGYDVVCGWRKDRKDKLLSRRLPSRAANWLITRITGVRIHDTGCALKAYRGEVIHRVALYAELHRFMPALTTLVGARITELVVNHRPRPFGRSKYGLARIWRVVLDLLLVKMLTGFAARPGAWFGGLAAVALLTAALCLILVGAVVPGVVAAILVLLGVGLAGHFVAMAIVGEMLLLTGDVQPITVPDGLVRELGSDGAGRGPR